MQKERIAFSTSKVWAAVTDKVEGLDLTPLIGWLGPHSFQNLRHEKAGSLWVVVEDLWDKEKVRIFPSRGMDNATKNSEAQLILLQPYARFWQPRRSKIPMLQQPWRISPWCCRPLGWQVLYGIWCWNRAMFWQWPLSCWQQERGRTMWFVGTGPWEKSCWADCCERGLGQRASRWSRCLRAASAEPTRAYAWNQDKSKNPQCLLGKKQGLACTVGPYVKKPY